jgi:hypothetical protein
MIYALIFLYAVNLLINCRKRNYENIYRSIYLSKPYVCNSIDCLGYQNRRSVMSYDSWLTDDGSYDATDIIEARVKELTSYDGEFTHRTFKNFYEALGSATIDEANTIAEYMADPLADLSKFGLFIKCLVIEKMEDWAKSQAEYEEDNGLIGKD